VKPSLKIFCPEFIEFLDQPISIFMLNDRGFVFFVKRQQSNASGIEKQAGFYPER